MTGMPGFSFSLLKHPIFSAGDEISLFEVSSGGKGTPRPIHCCRHKGKCKAVAGMEALLTTLCAVSVRETGPCFPEGQMWRKPKLGSLTLLFMERSEIEGCASGWVGMDGVA